MSGIWFKVILFLLPLFSWLNLNADRTSSVCHIYVDLASSPSLMQMVNAVQEPDEDYKLLILKRFHSRKTSLLESKNIQILGTYYLKNHAYREFGYFVNKNVLRFYLEHPKAQYHIHLNASHIDRSGRIFDIIPPEQVKSIHLYEDSVGRFLWDDSVLEPFFWLSARAPVYLHMRFPDSFSSVNKRRVVIENLKQKILKLTDEQKEAVAQMAGVDTKKIRPFFNQKPVAVFFDDPVLSAEETESFLQNLSEKYDIKSYHWIYKNHPRIREKSQSYDVLEQFVGSVEILPNEIPFEALMVAGFLPDYAAGYGSSVFFSLDADQVIGYIKRKFWEDYLPLLEQVGIVSEDKVFDVGEQEPTYSN